MAKKFPSSLLFASLLTYSPRGTSYISQRSRDACYAIKSGRESTVRIAVTRLVERWQGAGMADFFGYDVVLVPAPRSSPLVADALWPADVICREMVRQGLARSVEPALERVTAVPKSAVSRAGERPNVEKHLETMRAQAPLLAGNRITVVDDVITKGRTLYAGCVLVQEAAPTARVLPFGLVRTMGYVTDVDQIVDPCTGTLTYSAWGDVDREP